jgi:hypothetical protein
MSTREISNSDDVIDSRDVIARIAELEDIVPPAEEDDGTFNDERAELAALKALADEAEGYAPDWQYGETLIRRSYFVEYVEELCEDCGYLPKDLPSWIVIDWDATARNVEVDYTSVDFDGVEYLVR